MANPQETPRPLTPQERLEQGKSSPQRLELAYHRRAGISRSVVEFFETHTDRAYSVETVADVTRLPLASVKGAMSKLVKAGHVHRGQVSGMYVSASIGQAASGPQDGDALHVLKVRPDGDAILLDKDGTFWVATPVDI